MKCQSIVSVFLALLSVSHICASGLSPKTLPLANQEELLELIDGCLQLCDLHEKLDKSIDARLEKIESAGDLEMKCFEDLLKTDNKKAIMDFLLKEMEARGVCDAIKKTCEKAFKSKFNKRLDIKKIFSILKGIKGDSNSLESQLDLMSQFEIVKIAEREEKKFMLNWIDRDFQISLNDVRDSEISTEKIESLIEELASKLYDENFELIEENDCNELENLLKELEVEIHFEKQRRRLSRMSIN
ncbi:hypothetical protein ROZALSC1DRAFT_27192 [Rozella allomycis CSF55]|uniref:Uncharacterized protein n=1 Tax=Rozella allomycis (strain CSF55) TaxID=988480 RepID=A0A075AWD4_ROZAC|nr:hypothetical protein O9G_003845 [Rozella allomycis CSF55]RKP21410.1 hypothetical protein ROZALSC1DRAFT_27192 [Rozella allomycis CSF55]|eukprot:EPZ33022.1 hypothetical protein O9G_003845 [Rozella allomycis CSF55]